jgi:hypothetical protein
MARRHIDLVDGPGHLGGERNQPLAARREILGHEQPAPGQRPADDAEQPARPGGLRGGVQLHVIAHPGKLARFGDDLLPRVETDLQNRHGRAGDRVSHVASQGIIRARLAPNPPDCPLNCRGRFARSLFNLIVR